MTSIVQIGLLFLFNCFAADYEAGVPVIDYQALISDDESMWSAESAKFLFALENVGFFVLTNHRIPKEVMDSAWEVTRQFFDTSLENKGSVAMTDEYMYGYTAAEILSRSETSDGHEFKPDDKESFSMLIGSATSTHDPARWPKEPENMGAVVTKYYREMEKIVANLLRAVAKLLDVDPDFFEDKIDDHISAIRLLNYPHQEQIPEAGVTRCSPHTDYGTFTVLRQDAVGGLQVEKEHMSGEWIDVKTNFYDFSVNIGDLMRRWTNNRFRSTRHQVANFPSPGAASNRRQTLVFFHNLNPDALVKTIASCVKDGKSLYKPIKFLDYIESKHHATQIYNEDGKAEL